MNVDKSGHVRSGNESEQKNYNNVVESQLTELWSNYGDIFEIWFDGGVLPPESGGPEIIPLLEKYQPEAVVFQGPESWPSLIRWCGNERGEASYPCWSRTDTITSEDGTSEKRFTGSPNAEIWAPAEADMPNRDQKKAFMGGWFWRKGDEQYLYSSEHLKECYFSSVGRNANMLLGMVISPDGLVPRADVRQYAEFGEKIRNIYKNCMGKTAGDGNVQRLKVSPENKINMLLLMENIKSGEKVRAFTIEAKRNNKSEVIAVGSCIGHKRLIRIPEISAEELTLRITDCENDADIKEFSVWRIR
jgi:alpha-L-fucosidase